MEFWQPKCGTQVSSRMHLFKWKYWVFRGQNWGGGGVYKGRILVSLVWLKRTSKEHSQMRFVSSQDYCIQFWNIFSFVCKTFCIGGFHVLFLLHHEGCDPVFWQGSRDVGGNSVTADTGHWLPPLCDIYQRTFFGLGPIIMAWVVNFHLSFDTSKGVKESGVTCPCSWKDVYTALGGIWHSTLRTQTSKEYERVRVCFGNGSYSCLLVVEVFFLRCTKWHVLCNTNI